MALDATDLEFIARNLVQPIVDELRTEMRAMTTETRGVAGEMRAMRTEMVAGFQNLDARINQLLLTTGEHWRDHERRLMRLERHRDGNGSGNDPDESGDE